MVRQRFWQTLLKVSGDKTLDGTDYGIDSFFDKKMTLFIENSCLLLWKFAFRRNGNVIKYNKLQDTESFGKGKKADD